MINAACQPQDALDYINDQFSTLRDETRRGMPNAERCQSLDKLYSGERIKYDVIVTSPSPPREGAKHCVDLACVWVCLSARISQKPLVQASRKFL